MFVLAVSGVDGAGKSTFVDMLTRELRLQDDSVKVGNAWLRFDPKAHGGKTRAKGDVVSTVDARHRGNPLKRLLVRAGLGKLWVRLAVRLYRRQLVHQLSSVRGCDFLIADRFVLDFCADMIGAQAMEIGDVAPVLNQLPKANMTIVISAPVDVLMERKAAEEDARAIAERRSLYLELAKATGAPVIDTRSEGWQGQVMSLLSEARAFST